MSKLRLVKMTVEPLCPAAVVPASQWPGFSAVPLPEVVEIRVHPTLVLDDGEDITELPCEPVVIPVAEWPTYSSERFPREMAEQQARLAAQAESDTTPQDKGVKS